MCESQVVALCLKMEFPKLTAQKLERECSSFFIHGFKESRQKGVLLRYLNLS